MAFVLDDGEALGEALGALQARYGLIEVARLDVPYYDAVGGGSRNRRLPLHRVGEIRHHGLFTQRLSRRYAHRNSTLPPATQ